MFLVLYTKYQIDVKHLLEVPVHIKYHKTLNEFLQLIIGKLGIRITFSRLVFHRLLVIK